MLVHNVSLPLNGHCPATADAARAWAAVPLVTSITSTCQKESRCQQACLGGSVVLVHNVSLPLNGQCPPGNSNHAWAAAPSPTLL